MEASMDFFINLIQNNRILYDKSLKDFINVRKKEEAWKSIAAISRMTVDSAKKRYFSLRQKYCREKKNIEIRRRNKFPPRKLWLYHERLHFLDSFIQPRSTYTNDTAFDEEYDEDEIITEDFNTTPNIDIQLQEGIEVDNLNSYYEETENGEVMEEEHLVHATFDGHRSVENLDGEVIVTQRVISEYTGEESSSHEYLSTAILDQNDKSSDSARAVETATPRNEHALVEESMAMDSYYMSPTPCTSSSVIASSLRNDPAVVKNVSVQDDVMSRAANRPVIRYSGQNDIEENGCSQHQRFSRVDSSHQKTVPKKTVSRQDPRDRASAPLIPSVQKTATLHRADAVTDASKEKRMEAIRQKMESCLTAMTNKVTEKAHHHTPRFWRIWGPNCRMFRKKFCPTWNAKFLNWWTPIRSDISVI